MDELSWITIRVRSLMFAPYVEDLPPNQVAVPTDDDRTMAIEAAMRRVQLARENWYAVMFGSYRFVDDLAFAEHQKAEAIARAAIIQADLELTELLHAATAGAMVDEPVRYRLS